MELFFEAYATRDPFTGSLNGWLGTATLATIRKFGLLADYSYPLYGNAELAADGWGCKAPRNRF
jgi:hypothetical protein